MDIDEKKALDDNEKGRDYREEHKSITNLIIAAHDQTSNELHTLVDNQKLQITEKYEELNKKLEAEDKRDQGAFEKLH